MTLCEHCHRPIEPNGRGGFEHSGFDLTLDEHHRAEPRASNTTGFCGHCGRTVQYVSSRWQHVSANLTLDEDHRADPR